MSKKAWVLTREINQYDQDGEYFVAVFDKKPDLKKMAEVMRSENHGVGGDVMDAVSFLEHLLSGGGRRGVEDEWYSLSEVDLL